MSAKEWVSGDRDLMKSLMKEALEEVLEAEITEFLGAAPSERSETRSGYRAGYYHRGLVTRIGKHLLPLSYPAEPLTAVLNQFVQTGRGIRL